MSLSLQLKMIFLSRLVALTALCLLVCPTLSREISEVESPECAVGKPNCFILDVIYSDVRKSDQLLENFMQREWVPRMRVCEHNLARNIGLLH